MSEHSTNTDLLIQYLDGELEGAQLESVKNSIETDPVIREEYENLALAKQAVASYGLQEKIRSIHPEMMQELGKIQTGPMGITRMIYKYSVRVAAVLIVLFGVSFMYKYYTSTPEKLFSENFHSYDLRITRGSNGSSLEDLYEKGDMAGLISQFNKLKSPQAPDYFLAANAYLNMHHPDTAIAIFINLQDLNRQSHTHYYEEDIEYFLALSYLGNKEPAKALPLFEKIHASPNHPFHQAVSAWFLTRLKRTI
jgi:tetratricopeptide (TPR) repeat protein